MKKIRQVVRPLCTPDAHWMDCVATLAWRYLLSARPAICPRSLQGFQYITCNRQCVSAAAAALLTNPMPYTPGRPVSDNYNKDGCLLSTEGEGLLELDDDDVVSSGPSLPFEIFRTADGRGWGVRVSADILMGQFICEYIGAVLTDAEARKPRLCREKRNSHFMFETLSFTGWPSCCVISSLS